MTKLTTLTDLTIWDGSRVLDADTLQMRNGQISFVGARDDALPDPHAVSCSGLTAMPGLIDAHVHLELNPDEKDPPSKTLPEVVPRMLERAAAMAAAGITTARDLGGGAWHELRLRDRINAGEIVGPRLLCAGQPITSVGGHCHFWGGEAADADAAKQVLKRQVDAGVDLIKVMATGGRLTRGSYPTDAQFATDTLSEIVDLAHSHELPVAAHCHGTEGIHRAALAGVDTIEHCSWVGEEGWASDYRDDIARIILDNGVWVSPTVNKGWRRMLDSSTGKVLSRVRAAYQKMLGMGIPLVASTDAGIPGVYHAELPAALAVFSAIAELSPETTLKSATSDAARALGIGRQTGSLQVNMNADVLVVDGNPLTDLSALTRPAHVFCRGARAT